MYIYYLSISIYIVYYFIYLDTALIAEEFLNRTSHQLTYHGLSELASTVKDNQLTVFFRNNHFSTLYKHKVTHTVKPVIFISYLLNIEK